MQHLVLIDASHILPHDHLSFSLRPEAHLHEFEGGVLVRDTRRVMPFHLDPWFDERLPLRPGVVYHELGRDLTMVKR